MHPHITLDQWRALIEVVDTGGYAQAAEKLNKSQSAVTYAVQKIETLLGVKAFEIQGRKAVLTDTGHMLYRRALALVSEATELEQAAHKLSSGWDATITLAVEILFPSNRLLACLNRFSLEHPNTRIELIESVLGGTADALLSGHVDLAISPVVPSGFLGNLLCRVKIIAVARYDHPIHQQPQTLTYRDLRNYRHIVVRDSGSKRDQKAVTVEVNQRWTVSHIGTSIEAVSNGYGFAWLPEEHIRSELAAGILKPLPLQEGVIREAPLYLIVTRADFAGPGVKRLAELLIASSN